jgi:CheY-like chemotaxis protein
MSPSVLIVDDETAICDNLSAFLEDEGMRTAVAHSGEQALEMIAAGLEVDVCIMDLRLPGMNGTAAILAIRALRPGLGFVVHTGSAIENVAAELRRSGLPEITVFSKPLDDMARLAAILDRLCTAS